MTNTKRAGRRVPGLSSAYRYLNSLFKAFKPSTHPLLGAYPPGHFHSPLPDLQEVLAREETIPNAAITECPGIALRQQAQLDLLDRLAVYYDELPFPETPLEPNRYYFQNDYFSYADAIVLYGMLRHFQPRKVIEIGSGFSSAAMLDTAERFLQSAVDFTFIDPLPERLLRLMKAEDRRQHRVIAKRVQEVEFGLFEALGEKDILFIDSSHVAKIGSDVLHILFEIVPRLQSGVIVHFHDIFWPFEYPREWIQAGMIWNEAYLLRAFLQYNSSFEVLYFNSFMASLHRQQVEQKMALCLKNPGGSLWIKRLPIH